MMCYLEVIERKRTLFAAKTQTRREHSANVVMLYVVLDGRG